MPGIIRENAPALQGRLEGMASSLPFDAWRRRVYMTTAGRMAEPPDPAAGEKDSFAITG